MSLFTNTTLRKWRVIQLKESIKSNISSFNKFKETRTKTLNNDIERNTTAHQANIKNYRINIASHIQYDPPKMEGHSTQLNKKSPVRELSNRAIKSFSYTKAQQQSGYNPGCRSFPLCLIQFCLLLFLELF